MTFKHFLFAVLGTCVLLLHKSSRAEVDSIPVCTYCECGSPQQATASNHLKTFVTEADGTQCVCTCGRALGESCEDDGDCVKNLFCGSAATTRLPSTCQSMCNHPSFSLDCCGQYGKCSMLPNGDLDCSPNFIHCSQYVYFPICGEKGSERKTFRNRCEMEKENFSLRDVGQPCFSFLSIGDC